MTPVMQSKLYCADGIHNGNCWSAALASLLDLPLWMVPPFEDMFGRGSSVYMDRTDEWLLKMFGKELRMLGGHKFDEIGEDHYISIGQSARGVQHACIYRRGEMVHDPHPSNAGIISVKMTYHLEVPA